MKPLFVESRRREDCSGCCACAAACPRGAICMVQDGMGFRYPKIEDALCIDCGLCEKVCAFKPITRTESPESYAIRFPEYLGKSQSGGLGYAIMRLAIEKGYVVYGASMDADFVVRHRRVETMEGLEPLRLSKYVQSDMDGIPNQIMQDLRSGRKVLFSGTSCQCAGLGSLCSKYRENLVLVDLICHGVPSPYVWRGFLSWNAEIRRAKIKRAQFRDPSLGWHGSMTRIEFESGETTFCSNYYHLFINNLINRPSCGECPFASANRPSDMTIGDCWGIEMVLPGFADDNKGCSLMLINTPSGEAIFDNLSIRANYVKVALERVLQPSLYEPSKRHPRAELLEKVFISKGYSKIESMYGVDSLREKFKRLLHKLNPTNTKLYRRITK